MPGNSNDVETQGLEDKSNQATSPAPVRKPWLRRLVKVTLILFVLFVLGFASLQYLLDRKLTGILNRLALPKAREALGVNVTLNHAEASLFGLTANASGFRIANPAGFKEPDFLTLDKCDVDLGALYLFGGIIRVSEANIATANVVIVKNESGDVNAAKIADTVKALSAEKPPADSNQPLPRLLLDDVKLTARVEYIDHQVTNEHNRIAIIINAAADRIATYKRSSDQAGTVTVKSWMEDNTNLFCANLTATVQPFTVATKASFTLNGTIRGINLYEIEGIASQGGVLSEDISADLNINCDEGVFRSDSTINLLIKSPRFVGKKSMRLNAELPVTVQIGGTLDKPSVDILGTIMKSAGKALATGVNSVMTGSKIGDGLNALFRMLSPKKKNEDEKK